MNGLRASWPVENLAVLTFEEIVVYFTNKQAKEVYLLYDFKKIERKWQDRWVNEPKFKAVDFHPTKPKYYVLYEFYNISGNLHMGHLKGTVPSDALARYKRFKGYNVLFPIGGDSFGLPAENAAIKTGIDPHDFVAKGMKTVLDQSRALGLSFDYDRSFATSDSDYYKWTQWIFLQLLKNDKAYKEKGVVNFCPNCKTVLSNEDSQGGYCDRCHGKVVQKERWVWFLKMREYSQKLLGNIERINMAESLKDAQRNWIGRSEGIELAFDVVNEAGEKLDQLKIFTTCIETVYGVSFVVLAPEHKLIDDHKSEIKNMSDVQGYREKVSMRTELDRISDTKEKSGCQVEGVYAINPANGSRVPVYAADFVLANYGTGAVMAVACHDQRDYEFAQVFDLPMPQVIEGDCSHGAVEKTLYLEENRKLINSQEFSGMTVSEAREKIADKLIAAGVAKRQVNYKMQDWPFNRQRYWGEPFPVVFCDHCGTVPLPEDELPLLLPETSDYLPNEFGDSPLSKVTGWVNCKCPCCGGLARRETDTMPNWAGSSWYWLRYTDPHNKDALADYKKLEYWGSVDCYTGGTEHITRHVLYAFFWQNFLYEIGAVPSRDPFIRKMGSGLILDDEGKKMSKSSANGVSPITIIEQYGADVARTHLHFLGGYDDNTLWTMKGITSIANFLNRIWDLQEIVRDGDVSEEHIYEINRMTKKIEEDIENLKLNTVIAACMSFVKKVRTDGFITKEELRRFLVLFNPVAPHVTSEIFERVFGTQILDETWPEYDENFLQENVIQLPIQLNGKMKGTISVPADIEQDELVSRIRKEYPKVLDKDTNPKKVIYIPKRIVNIIR